MIKLGIHLDRKKSLQLPDILADDENIIQWQQTDSSHDE